MGLERRICGVLAGLSVSRADYEAKDAGVDKLDHFRFSWHMFRFTHNVIPAAAGIHFRMFPRAWMLGIASRVDAGSRPT